jgi:two-component system phosphate regulon response regulator OmpR
MTLPERAPGEYAVVACLPGAQRSMATRVLIIDDDGRLAEMLASYLGPRGFSVEHRESGRAGLEALEHGEAFEAVILDVMLPDLDGFEVCRRIRARSQIPILMLTARGDATDRIVGLEIGADDYLPKPFEPRELVARLSAILRRTRPAASGEPATPPLRFGKLVIDPLAREVRVGEERRELTGRQFDLLLFLAQRPGRVLSREQIMEALRGEDWESFDRSIDVHVSRIRSAIEDDPRRPRFVQTVRGTGYVFSPPPPEEPQ